MRNRSALLTAALLGLVGSAVAQTGDSMAGHASQAASMPLSRAEVLADLDLWHRAGMTYWPAPPGEMDLRLMGDYQAALARYQQLRGGPAYQEAVAKYRGMSGQ